MKEINLGHILTVLRRKRGITQEELAAHLEVSKGAVSKWETGASLPDLTLLPRLASYFAVSIDDLIGYEPQMEKAEIRKLYCRLTKEFSLHPFDNVYRQCCTIAKKYYSCYPLLFQMATLLVNHSMLAPDPNQTENVTRQALTWFHRVRTEAEDPTLQKQALQMEAYCLLSLHRPDEVLELLPPEELQIGPAEPLLAMAFQMTGQHQEARKILQAGIYSDVLSLLNLLSSYMNLCLENPAQFKETCQRILKLSDTFRMESLHPGLLLGIYITMAQGWMALGYSDRSLDALKRYTDLATRDIYPMRLHGDTYFDLLDDWLNQTLTLGEYPPRDDALIRNSILQAVSENPAFLPLAEHPEFQILLRKLTIGKEER